MIKLIFRTNCLVAIFGLMLANANAADIILRVQDASGEGFNDNSAPRANQTGNTGATLGEQRLQVFQAAADYWEQQLVIKVDVVVNIAFDSLFCSASRVALASAGPSLFAAGFSDAPLPNVLYVSALVNNLAGSRITSKSFDISATFNSKLNNDPDCLGSTDWWLGINSSAVSGTISLFDTVLHEIGHGLGVISSVNQDGALLGEYIDAYSYYLYDEDQNQFWRNLTQAQRVTSSTNTGDVTFNAPNVNANTGHITTGKNSSRLRVYAPSPYENGSSISHWDTTLVPDELMEPTATLTSDDRATLQMLKDIGWELVQDQNSGEIGFVSNSFTAEEADGTATIEVQRTGGTVGTVTITLNSLNGTATENADYTAISNNVISWADEETGIKTVSVALVNDNDFEPNETVNFALSNVTGGATLGTSASVLTITSEDLAMRGTISFVSDAVTAPETNDTVSVQVQRLDGSDGEVSATVNFTDITAIVGEDYLPIDNPVIEWGDGDSEPKNVVITLIDDSVVETDQTVELTLSDATGGASLIANDTSTLTITSNEQIPPAGIISFVNLTVSFDEGAGSVLVSLQRTDGNSGAVSAKVTSADRSTTKDEDYIAVDQTIEWSDGEDGIKNFTLTITDDNISELDETSTLNIVSATNGAVISNGTVTVTIVDNDDADILDLIVPIMTGALRNR